MLYFIQIFKVDLLKNIQISNSFSYFQMLLKNEIG